MGFDQRNLSIAEALAEIKNVKIPRHRCVTMSEAERQQLSECISNSLKRSREASGKDCTPLCCSQCLKRTDCTHLCPYMSLQERLEFADREEERRANNKRKQVPADS